jgi:outer membrane immunogenic protein
LQQGNTIFGVEADYGMPNTSTTFSTLWDPDEYFIVNELSTLGSVRGRLGVTLDRSLVYVTGGVAFGKVDNQYSYGNFSVSEKGWRNGWVGGAGIEHAIDQKLSFRAEGLFYDLGTESVSGLDNEIEKRFDFYNSALVARIGLSYKF